MGIEIAKNQNLLYHLTKLSNLKSIINHGMLPRRKVMEQRIQFGDIADAQIISKRQELGLDIYTPFHFHPYSAFDVAVKHTYQNEDMIYMCISRKKQNGKIIKYYRNIRFQKVNVSCIIIMTDLKESIGILYKQKIGLMVTQNR